MKIDVVRDHQIDETVAVVITEGGAGGPAAISNAGFGGHVSKCAIAIVVEEHIAAQASEIKVRPTIIVVVADGAAHGEAGRAQTGFVSDVAKSSVLIVMVKRSGTFLTLYGHLHRRSVSKINI